MLPDEFPFTGGSEPENEGAARAAYLAADHIHVDHGEFAVVRELWQGEAIDDIERGRFMGEGGVEGQDGIGLFAGDADRLIQVLLFPIIGQAGGEIDLFGKLVEGLKGQGLAEVIFYPIVIIEFEKAAGVGADHQVVMLEVAIHDRGVDGVHEFFGARDIGAGGCFLCPRQAGDKGKT